MPLSEILKSNTYPGRGILIGRSPGIKRIAIAYFIMGRSENSRNRIFVPTPDGISTVAFDKSSLPDPSLYVYSPVRKLSGNIIVSNGDQTDTIYDYILMGKSFEDALHSRTFEPDPPIYTPRISGIIYPDGGYKLSILKTLNGNPESALRFFYEYAQPVAGKGHFIHTYKHDGEPVPSFTGEPYEVDIPNTAEELAELIWNSLNEQNKISLYVSFIDPASGESESKLINKNA